MKKIVSLIMVIMCISSYSLANQSFLDTNNHWAKNEINTLIKEDVIQGYNDGTFKPNQYITVNEFLKMLVEMADYKLVTQGNRWPDWYVNTAIKNNLIKEVNDGNVQITRYEVVNIISNYINLNDIKKSKNNLIDLDVEYKDFVLKLVKLEIINGYPDQTFRGNNKITRAEACKIILKAYKVKQELSIARKCELSYKNTNMKKDDNFSSNVYEIKNNRLYFYDTGRYASLNGQTLNQEYINDNRVIKVLKALSTEDSYIELEFVPDKYIINNLNLCYYDKNSTNEWYAFEIRFYENSLYDVSRSKDNSEFMKDASIKINTGKMWSKKYELENDVSASDRSIYALKEAIGSLLGKDVKDEFVDYILEKRKLAGTIPNTGKPKFMEVKKIGKYTINTYCSTDKDIEIFIQKF